MALGLAEADNLFAEMAIQAAAFAEETEEQQLEEALELSAFDILGLAPTFT